MNTQFQDTNIKKDIICPACGYGQSKVVYAIGPSGKREFGECVRCGAQTYKIWIDKNQNFGTGEPTVTCPFCHSTDCKKISASAKIGKTLMWGVLAAGAVSKTWHCNNCGSNFG